MASFQYVDSLCQVNLPGLDCLAPCLPVTQVRFPCRALEWRPRLVQPQEGLGVGDDGEDMQNVQAERVRPSQRRRKTLRGG